MIVLIDNYDSFTYNVLHSLGRFGEVIVKRNDALTADALLAMQPQAIVLSPGPGRPENAGICLDVIASAARAAIPVLGICLGHQAIGQHFGARVCRHKEITHGKTDTILHHQEDIFAGIEDGFEATRYHSLIVDEASLPNCLSVTARLKDGTIMALKHHKKPLYGVQFHPESIRTKRGDAIIENFLSLAGVLPKAAKRAG